MQRDRRGESIRSWKPKIPKGKTYKDYLEEAARKEVRGPYRFYLKMITTQRKEDNININSGFGCRKLTSQ